jgi:hypothetical protein
MGYLIRGSGSQGNLVRRAGSEEAALNLAATWVAAGMVVSVVDVDTQQLMQASDLEQRITARDADA